MIHGRLVLSVALALAPLMSATAVFTAPSSAVAAEKKTVGPKLAPAMSEVQKLMAARKYGDVLKTLQEADAVPGKSSYEQYVINEFRGAANQALKRYGDAAKAYEATLSSGELSSSEIAKRQVLLAQLYNSSNNSGKAIEFANKVLASNPGNPDMLRLVGQSYYARGDYPNAVKYISNAVSSEERSGQRPAESSLQILMSAHYKQGNNPGYTSALEKMVRYYPSKKDYWNDLGRGLLNTKGITDKQSLDVWRLLLDVGAVKTAKDYTNIAELALLNGSPGEAKAALEKGFKEGLLGKGNEADRQSRLLATATARANASLQGLPAQDSAAKAKPTGGADADIGETYMGHGDYANAIAAFERALQKGGLDDDTGTKLHLAQAYAKSKQTAKALSILKGINGDGMNANLARLWAIHLS